MGSFIKIYNFFSPEGFKMRFGYAPYVIGLLPYFPEVDFETIREQTVLSERLGFEGVWVFDHLSQGGEFPTGTFTDSCLECWTTMTALAMSTEKMRVGALVLCNPFRIPSVLAKMGATLDVISGGRLDMSIGIGWHEPEFTQYGIPFRTFRERYEMLDEGLEIIKGLWSEDEVTFRGKYYKVEDAVMEPKPVQKPRPPIWIGGIGKRYTLRLVAKHADWWNCGHGYDLSILKGCLESLKGHCRDLGRDYETIHKSKFISCFVSEDEGEIAETVEATRGMLPARDFMDLHLIGTPETCLEKIEVFSDLEIEYMMVKFLDTPSSASLELFGKKVLPEALSIGCPL